MGFKAANRESFPYIMHIVDEPRKFSPSNVLTYTVLLGSRAAKTPIPTETKSQPSLDSKSLSSSSSPQSSRNSPSELRKQKLKDDKTTSRR